MKFTISSSIWSSWSIYLAILCCVDITTECVESSRVKDFFAKFSDKLTGTNRSVIPESVPVCGSSIFSTGDKQSVSPQVIMISSSDNREHDFNAINASIDDLRAHRFRADLPTTFLIHGFTSGYPHQAWMSGIVELFKTSTRHPGNYDNHNNYNSNNNNNYNQTDNQNYSHKSNYNNHSSYDNHNYHGYSDRPTITNNGQSHNDYDTHSSNNYGTGTNSNNNNDYQRYRDRDRDRNSERNTRQATASLSTERLASNDEQQQRRRQRGPDEDGHKQVPQYSQNLFAVNWHYGARGINYPRAVANIPTVASYLVSMIDRLTEEAGVDGRSITLIGHSLGAHLSGFVAKNTKARIGRVYGLDPAGPCFGSIANKLYPSDKRLAPSDADEVVTIHTNSALLGIGEPLGSRSIFVEGGKNQPGCKSVSGSLLDSLENLSYDGDTTVSCSHARAPLLLTNERDAGCHLVAYECKDWESFERGFCAQCDQHNQQCYRVGLDWQHPVHQANSNNNNERRRLQRQQQQQHNDSSRQSAVQPRTYYAKTGDTQPYCLQIYQIVVELESPFDSRLKPRLSIVLEDEMDKKLSSEELGFKRTDTEYTHLLTNAHRTGRIVSAKVLVPDGIEYDRIKRLHVNYMSSIEPDVRRQMSSTLCPIRQSDDRNANSNNNGYDSFSTASSTSGSYSHSNTHTNQAYTRQSSDQSSTNRRGKQQQQQQPQVSPTSGSIPHTQNSEGKFHRINFRICQSSGQSPNVGFDLHSDDRDHHDHQHSSISGNDRDYSTMHHTKTSSQDYHHAHHMTT